ncbi:MAG: SMC family ATPase [bacterium]|nr:SMC family ATPase [bacterium]
MIILNIYARNFMKYEELRIREIPRKGIVGIVGDNESGKSTILEAITCSIFGRTVKVQEDSIVRLIHWRGSEMEIRLSFELNDQQYRVWRRYDREGGKEAILYRVVDDREEILKEGLGPVDSHLSGLFPIDFDVYRQSFYLGQKELSNLYEKRVPNSLDLMDQMTGLGRLKGAHQKVTDQLPEVMSEIIDLEKKQSIIQVKIESLQERLDEREGIESDLQRQQERYEEVHQQRKTEEMKVSTQERFRQDLQRLIQSFSDLRKNYLGYEYKRRLKIAGIRFQKLYYGLRNRISELQNEECRLRELCDEKEKQFEVSQEIFRELKAIQCLVQDRLEQLNSNSQSNFGSENMKSYFSPSTLKEREVLAKHQLQEHRDQNVSLVSSFRMMGTVLTILTLSIVVWVLNQDFQSGAEFASRFQTLDPMFQIGMILFTVPLIALLSWFMYSTNQEINVSKEAINKLTFNLKGIQHDINQEIEEVEKLRTFDLNRIRGFETLSDLRISFKYEPLRRRLCLLVDSFQDRKELFQVGLEQFRAFQDDIEGEVRKLKKTLIELDHHSHVSKQYASLSAEIDSWSFVEKTDETLASEDFSSTIFAASTSVARLKELLKGDFSKEEIHFTTSLNDYNELKNRLASDYDDSSLLPDIWDKKRLEWDWDESSMIDIELDVFLDKMSWLDEQSEYLLNLRTSWFEKFQKNKESLLNEEFDEKASSQRIRIMEETISKLNNVAQQKDELSNNLDETNGQLQDTRKEQNKLRLLEKLFRGTIESVQARLSPNLARFIGAILPEITEQRYGRVRVSHDLQIEVYSPDKEGYIDFTSLSGGTADQLLICLRLAFATSLVQSTFHENYEQFLCLDEPLHAFDSKRALTFLEMVMKFNPNFQQVFLITHNANLFSHFDRVLEANIETASLDI